MLGYGPSLAVGLGIPIPILNERMATFTGISDDEIYTQIIDYGNDAPKGITNPLGKVNYAELKSGSMQLKGQKISTVPLSSYTRALEIAGILKDWIENKQLFLTEPHQMLPTAPF